MAEANSVAGGVVRPVRNVVQSFLSVVEESLLTKLVLTDGLFIAVVLGLFAIGGDFTREEPSAFGVLGAFLAALAGLLGLLTVLYAIGVGTVRGYHSLSGR